MKLNILIAAMIAVSGTPAFAQDAMAAKDAMAPQDAMMAQDAMAPKMTPAQMRQMTACTKMGAAKAAKNKACAALKKAHNSAM
jgi:hypothetical protein